MNRKNVTILAAVVVAVLISAYAGGFFGGEEIHILSVRGSTTVLPVAQIAAEKFMDLHSNVDIHMSGGGSSVGIQSVGEGTVDIGMASRELKDSEKTAYPDLNPIVIAKDGIALIIHPSNPVNSLTIEEIKWIYDGTYTNWSQLGGTDTKIVVIGRDSASGTREFFWKYVMKKGDSVNGMLEKNSNGAVKQTVSQTPGAVGYVGFGYIDEAVKALKIRVGTQEVEPTVVNVQGGLYPISRNLYFVVHYEPEGLEKDFIDFLLSDEGQRIVEEEGFIPLSGG